MVSRVSVDHDAIVELRELSRLDTLDEIGISVDDEFICSVDDAYDAGVKDGVILMARLFFNGPIEYNDLPFKFEDYLEE